MKWVGKAWDLGTKTEDCILMSAASIPKTQFLVSRIRVPHTRTAMLVLLGARECQMEVRILHKSESTKQLLAVLVAKSLAISPTPEVDGEDFQRQ